MTLPDSAPDKWIMHEHTKVKLELLEKYLRGWIPILGKWHTRVLYVDGFAGRGQYSEEDGGSAKITDGSPIRAMRVAQSLKQRVREFVAIFIERNMDNYVNLRKTVLEEQSRCPDVRPTVIHGEFAEEIGKTLDQLDKQGQSLAPAFFFVDPFGFGGVPFEIIKRIMSNRYAEVFLTFMSRDLNRFINSPSHASTLDELFGTPQWRTLANLPDERRQERLVELYGRQLTKDAGVQYVWPFKVSHTEYRHVFYHLLHASNHFKALMLMKTIMHGQGAAGTFTYFGPEEVTLGKDQTRLLSSELAELKETLLAKFKGSEVSFEDVMKRTWETRYIEKEYRAALKQLKTEGRVKIRPVSSKTEEGLKDDDSITFP